jgi:tRNA (pseudouridine54-N1)-methyltransferase
VRRILLLAHRVPVSGAFTLNDLAGGAGRMDEVARSVSTAFTLSNDLRRDTEMTVLFVAEPPPRARRIRLVGPRLRFLNPDERSTAALLKNALVRSIPAERETEASPGLFVGPVDPEAEVREFAGLPGAFWLTESGSPLRESPLLDGGFAAVLSDPYDPSEAEAALLVSLGLPKLALGPRSIRSSQCLDVLHNEADQREAAAAARARAP